MELTEKEKMYLKIYKGADDDYLKQYETSNMEPLERLNIRLRYIQLWYKNINVFLNFIKNPDANNFKNLIVEDVGEIVDMIKTLIDVACKASLYYPIQDCYYRYENIQNLNSYKDGLLSNFKSTSWNVSSAEEFKKNNAALLEYNINGFCPFIPVDKMIDGGLFSDEHEFLFPPYLDCNIHDNNVEVGFSDKEDIDETDYNLYNMMFLLSTKDNFNEQFNKDKSAGKVSEELREYCENILQYLYTYARLNYRVYEQEYMNQNNESKKI